MFNRSLSAALILFITACPVVCGGSPSTDHHHAQDHDCGQPPADGSGDPCSAEPCFCSGQGLPAPGRYLFPGFFPEHSPFPLLDPFSVQRSPERFVFAHPDSVRAHPDIGSALPLRI